MIDTAHQAALRKLRIILAHEPKPSPLVSCLADYAVEKDPVMKRYIMRRFYVRLNAKLKKL